MRFFDSFIGLNLKKREKAFNRVKLLESILAIIFILFGIVLFTKGFDSDKTIGIVLGVILIIDGIINIYSRIMPDSNELYRTNMIFGIINIIIAFLLITNVIRFVNFLQIYYGAYFIINGIKLILLTINLKRLEDKSFLIIGAMAALTLVLGGLLMFYQFQSFTITEVIAIFSILHGVLTINNSYLLRGRVKRIA